jgi:hypothetical protein
MIVGIVSLALGVFCGVGFVGSPVAWVLGHRAKRRIDASDGQVAGRGNAQAGFVLGIIGTVLLILGIIAVVVLIVTIGVSTDWGTHDSSSGTPA